MVKEAVAWIVGIVLVLAAIFGLALYGFEMDTYFMPRREALRRDTMIQGLAYSQAATRELYNLKLQYVQAKTDEERDTIKAYALHEATAFDKARLPLDLQAFLTSIGG
jgi:hypothetical protein